MTHPENILVTGAAGKLGRLVIANLLKSAPETHVIGLVRDAGAAADLAASGVELRVANYDDATAITSALTGAERLLLISSNAVGHRIAQHRNLINAAVAAGTKFIVYTSILHADINPLLLANEHRVTESDIRASGVPFTLLRNGWYTENYTAGLAVDIGHGVILGASREGRISAAARSDYAAAAAIVLAGDMRDHARKVYELAGDEAFSLPQYAAEVERQSGRPLVYRDLSESRYRAALLEAGLPEDFAGILADASARAAHDVLHDDSRRLSVLIGRPTTSLAHSVAQALATVSAGSSVGNQ